MRAFLLPLMIGLLTTGGARASSFVVLEPMKEALGPSMVELGEPAPAQHADSEDDEDAAQSARAEAPSPRPDTASGPPSSFYYVSPSILAMNDYTQPVTMETVAAIDEDKAAPHNRLRDMPMVIRGGMVGDAFPHAVVATQPATPDKTPEPQVASDAPQANAPARKPRAPAPDNPPQPPAAPAPAPTPPSPPTRQPE